MTNQTTSSKSVMINYGVLLGIIFVLFGVVLFVMNNHYQPHWSLGVLNFLISVTVITLAIQSFKKGNGHILSLGQAIKIGIGVSLIAGIISIVWQLVLTNVLDPNYTEAMLDIQREALIESQPNMTDEQLDDALDMISKFSNPLFTSAVGLIASVFFGFIISLIAGLIMKKEHPHA